METFVKLSEAKSITLLLSSIVVAYGCTAQARYPQLLPEHLDLNRRWTDSVRVGVDSTDTQATYADLQPATFRRALVETINRTKLFGRVVEDGESDFDLRANIRELRFMVDKGTVIVAWQLSKSGETALVFQQEITTRCERSAAQQLSGFGRAQWIFECAGNANIAEALRRMSAAESAATVSVNVSDGLPPDKSEVFLEEHGPARLQSAIIRLGTERGKLQRLPGRIVEVTLTSLHLRSAGTIAMLGLMSGTDSVGVRVRVRRGAEIEREYETGTGSLGFMRGASANRLDNIIEVLASRIVEQL